MGPNDATRAFASGFVADPANTNTCQEYDTSGYCIKGGWMDVVLPVLRGDSGYFMITRMSDTHVRVLLPAFPTYDIFAPDLINIYIPAEAVFSNQLIVASTQIRIEATRGVVTMVGGTLLTDNRERALQEGGASGPLTLHLLLQSDSWHPNLGNPSFYQRTQALLGGLKRNADAEGRPAEPSGWEATILPQLIQSCSSLECNIVQRVNSELLILTLASYADYDISYPETIRLDSPRSAVLSDQAITSVSLLVIRPNSGTAHLTGTLVDPTRFGLPSPLPIREAEMVAGETLIERTLRIITRVNASDVTVKAPLASSLELYIEIRNDTWKLQGAPLDMAPHTKRVLVEGLKSEKDECTGWNALVASSYEALIGGMTVLSPYRVRLTLPVLPEYDVRVPETIRLTVPGTALTSGEDVPHQQPGEPDNEFTLLPDEEAAERLQVTHLDDGESVEGALQYFSEQWYTYDPGDAAVALRIDAAFNEGAGRYGALHLQVYEDASLLTLHYSGCGGTGTTCGDGMLQGDGTRACRCVRTDLEQGRTPDYVEAQSTLLLERQSVVYATPSLGYEQASSGIGCQSKRARLWFSVRCIVDICGDRCRYNVTVTRLPYTIDDGDVITAPIEAGSWQYFKVPLGNYDVLDLSLRRLVEVGQTPEYRLAQALAPSLPPIVPSAGGNVSNSTGDDAAASRRRRLAGMRFDSAGVAAPDVADATAHEDEDEEEDEDGDQERGRLLQSQPSHFPVEGVDAPLTLTEHGLVGGAYARRSECADPHNAELQMEVGLDSADATAGLFCTDASQTGDMYVGVEAVASYNNVTLAPRHWFTLTVAHERFDDSALSTAESRLGCLAFGQWRHYRIVTHGAIDATLDATIDVPVSALYARRDAPPTETEYDAIAPWPLQRIAVSGCDVQSAAVWYVAARLDVRTLAASRSPPLLQQRFSLSATLRAANVSLIQHPLGTRISLPHNYLCCDVYQDFIVEDITRSLALRVEVTVHEGYLKAIFLKHESCARYPDDIGPDETCLGRCQMKWLTTYNPYTLEPTYIVETTVNVPLGIVLADMREAGNWYISVAAADVVTNFSLTAELIESPVIDQYIPLDEERAAAERCGRFCVVLSTDAASLSGLDNGLLSGAAASRQSGSGLLAMILSAVAAAALAWGRIL